MRALHRGFVSLLCLFAPALVPCRVGAETPFGIPEFGHVLILDDRGEDLDDQIDTWDTRKGAFKNAHLVLPTAIRFAELAGVEAPVRWLVPTAPIEASVWTAPEYDDASWPQTLGPLGYDRTVASRPVLPVAYWDFERRKGPIASE